MSAADPMADALRTVLNRRGKQYVTDDDLGFARRLREVAQVTWMRAGEPERLREEDADRSHGVREVLEERRSQRIRYAQANTKRAQKRRLQLVPPP